MALSDIWPSGERLVSTVGPPHSLSVAHSIFMSSPSVSSTTVLMWPSRRNTDEQINLESHVKTEHEDIDLAWSDNCSVVFTACVLRSLQLVIRVITGVIFNVWKHEIP